MIMAKRLFKEEIIKNQGPKGPYIEFFFHDIAGVSEKPIFHELSTDPGFFASIVKDSTSRIIDRNSTGRSMEKAWRNCLFFFLDRKEYYSLFGSAPHPTKYALEEDDIVFSETFACNETENPRIDYKTIQNIETCAFQHFRRTHSSWFVRSYVYLIFALVDTNGVICKRDFFIYYWNTNYAFKEAPGKTDLFNNTQGTIFSEDVLGEIKLIEDANKDVIDCVDAFRDRLCYHWDTE